MIYMKYLMKYFLFSVLFSLSLMSVSYAQQVVRPEEVIGKINGRSADGKTWHFEMRNNLEKYSRYYPQMNKIIMQAFAIVTEAQVVSPPKGFYISPSLAAFKKQTIFPASKVISGLIDLLCFNYAKNRDGSAGVHKSGESHGGIRIEINDLQHTYKVEHYMADVCADINYPDLFFFPEIYKISSTQLLINKNSRVLKKAGRPIFTPLTNQEYYEFMIKKIKYDLENTMYDGLVGKIKNLLQQYETNLQKLSPQEKKAPVYVVDDYGEHYTDYDYYLKPSSATSPSAKMLYRINPQYYDSSLRATTPQVLIVHWHASGYCPLFEKRALQLWFRQIDYEALQAMVK